MCALQINVLHKQEDTQAKEVTREVAGALLREASSRLAPQCPCAEISALPLSLLLSVWLACCCLWKPAGGSYLCLAGHMAFTGAHVASPHCGGMLDRSSSGERSALVPNSRKSFTVARHGTGSSLVYDSSASMWHRPGNSSMGNRAWLQPPNAYHFGLMFMD